MTIRDKITQGKWTISEKEGYLPKVIIRDHFTEGQTCFAVPATGDGIVIRLKEAKANAVAIAAVGPLLDILIQATKLEHANPPQLQNFRVQASQLLNQLNSQV